MPTIDARIDAYIEKSRDFAKPILDHLRGLIHDACPDINETIKWGMPFFDLKGLVCSFAAFNEHCAFGFWKQELLESSDFPDARSAMGCFGRITSLDDLPADDVVKNLIVEAVRLNIEGIKVKKPARSKELIVPDLLIEALAKDERAAATFEKFPYSKRKDYVQWIQEAKTDATRDRRLATTIEWLADGKSRNWKYEKC